MTHELERLVEDVLNNGCVNERATLAFLVSQVIDQCAHHASELAVDISPDTPAELVLDTMRARLISERDAFLREVMLKLRAAA